MVKVTVPSASTRTHPFGLNCPAASFPAPKSRLPSKATTSDAPPSAAVLRKARREVIMVFLLGAQQQRAELFCACAGRLRPGRPNRTSPRRSFDPWGGDDRERVRTP